MINTMQRMLAIPSGKRVSMKLDKATWHAIDWLAEQRGKSWQEWCADVLADSGEQDNMTAMLREAAMSGLLEETVFPDRAEQQAAMENHPLIRDSGTLDNTELRSILSHAQIQGRSDFGGFEVIFGFDEHGQDCVWIQNGLRKGLHFAFTVPSRLANSVKKEARQ